MGKLNEVVIRSRRLEVIRLRNIEIPYIRVGTIER